MLTTISIIIGIIVGIFTIIGGLHAFFTKTNIGSRWWTGLTTAFWRLAAVGWVQRKKILALILVLALSFVGYRYWWVSQTKSVEGTIYYIPSQEKPGLIPVPYVTVFLSQEPNYKSEPTNSTGRFVIPDIPIKFKVTHLTAQLGAQHFGPVSYRETRDYAIIPGPPDERPDYREINASWVEASAADCLSENEQVVNVKKRYLLETILPADPDKHEALLTVELQAADPAMILSASVLLPSDQELYSDAMQGLDEKRAHRWLFSIPKNGLKIKLEVCLSSNDSSAAAQRPHAYYKLR